MPLKIANVITIIFHASFCLHILPMSSFDALIFCLLLLQSEGNVTAPQGRMLAVPTMPAQTTPIAVPFITQQTTERKQLSFRDGRLVLPRHHQVTLSAPVSAVLRSLRTEQRDATGNVMQDSEGQPIMIHISEGMNVFKGQVLGNFDDRELNSILKIKQAELEVAKAERDKDIEIEYAAHSLQVAIANHQMMTDGNKRLAGTYAATEVRRAKLEEDQARANLRLQQHNVEELKTRAVTVREHELAQTEVQIGLRKLNAEIDGMIVKIGAAEGEWLREGDPVLEIVQLDTLLARVKVSAKEYSFSDFDGKMAKVHVSFANGRVETFQGAVIFCNPIAEVGNTFEVTIEVQNRRVGNFWLLQPGLNDMDIEIPL